MGMGDVDLLRKRKDYSPLSKPTRTDGWLDLKADAVRLIYAIGFVLHVFKGLFVDVARIIFGDNIDRDKGQQIGTFLMAATLIGLIAALL